MNLIESMTRLLELCADPFALAARTFSPSSSLSLLYRDAEVFWGGDNPLKDANTGAVLLEG